MDDNTTAVAIFGPFFIFGLPVMAWIAFRYLAHRERMEMIRHGMAPDPRLLRRPAPPPAAGERADATGDECNGLHKGIRLTAIGLAVTIGLSFIGYHDGEIHPGPWLIGGLVPLFVGLSQVVSAMVSARTPRPYGAWQPHGAAYRPDASAQPNGPAPGATYEGPYAYRPDGTQELRPPTPPPARRG